jgi:hypothetical protein
VTLLDCLRKARFLYVAGQCRGQPNFDALPLDEWELFLQAAGGDTSLAREALDFVDKAVGAPPGLPKEFEPASFSMLVEALEPTLEPINPGGEAKWFVHRPKASVAAVLGKACSLAASADGGGT